MVKIGNRSHNQATESKVISLVGYRWTSAVHLPTWCREELGGATCKSIQHNNITITSTKRLCILKLSLKCNISNQWGPPFVDSVSLSYFTVHSPAHDPEIDQWAIFKDASTPKIDLKDREAEMSWRNFKPGSKGVIFNCLGRQQLCSHGRGEGSVKGGLVGVTFRNVYLWMDHL